MAVSRAARVAVIDEHDVVRAGVGSWLAAESPTLTMAGGFPSAAAYLAWLGHHPLPDVVVAEIHRDGFAPDIDGLRRLCSGGAPVVVFSRANADGVILACLDAGARCYVAKADGREHLLAALRGIGDGRTHIAPRMAGALERRGASGRLNLSDRERQVLVAWLGTGSKDEVGRLLRIAPATVRTHLRRIRVKYAGVGRPAPTKSALLARAVEDGIVGLAELGGEPSSRLR